MTGLKNHFQNVVNHDSKTPVLKNHHTFVMDLTNMEGRILSTLKLPEKSIVVENGVVQLRAGYSYPDHLDLISLPLEQRHSLYKHDISVLTGLTLKAEEGDWKAQYELGSYYYAHFESAEDISRSLDMYKRSADQGSIDALDAYVMLVLSCKRLQMMKVSGSKAELEPDCIKLSNFVEGVMTPPYEEIIPHMTRLMNQGYGAYHQQIAFLYDKGWGVERDEFLALVHYMYSLAFVVAEEVDALFDAEEKFQERLVTTYLKFFDDEREEEWLLIDYIQGFQHDALHADYKDLLVEEFDFEKLELPEKVFVAFVMTCLRQHEISFEWFQEISEVREHPYIHLMMSVHFGQSKDEVLPALAHSYLTHFPDEENLFNLCQLAENLNRLSGPESAVPYFERAAAVGSQFAQRRLTEIYRKIGGQANYGIAFSHLSRLSMVYSPEITYLKGKMILKGQGTEQDEAQALQLIQEAATLGYTKAQYRLGDLYRQQNNIDMMIYWWLKAGLAGHRLAALRSGLFFLSRLDLEKRDALLARMSFERGFIELDQKMQALLDLGLKSVLYSCEAHIYEKSLDDRTRALIQLTVADIYYFMGKIYNKLAFVDEALIHYEKSKALGNIENVSFLEECRSLKNETLVK